jgi:hypothetical protein
VKVVKRLASDDVMSVTNANAAKAYWGIDRMVRVIEWRARFWTGARRRTWVFKGLRESNQAGKAYKIIEKINER